MKLVIIIITAFALVGANIGNIKDEGVIFQHLGKVNLITSFHNSVITLDIEKFTNSINQLINIMRNNKNIIDPSYHFLSSYYDFLINNVIDQIEMKRDIFLRYIDNFSDLSSKKESYDNDENALNEIINVVEKNNDDDDDDDDDNVSIINSYISKVNTKKNVMSDIDKAVYGANLTLIALTLHVNDNSSYLYNVSSEIVLAQSINFCELALRDFNEEIKQLLYKLDSILATSKTSVLIIMPETFKNFLVNLQNYVTLIYPPTKNYIPEYYTISKTIVKKKDNKLYFIIQIPIKSNYEYNLYKLHFLWLPLNNLPGWSRRINEKNNYLAISQHQGQYALFNTLDFCAFLKSSMICIPTREIKFSTRLYHKEPCLLSIFYNEKPNDYCGFTYERNRKSNFIKIKSFWIGSILEDDDYILENCVGTSQHRINIPKGIVILTISNNCTYSGNKFLLPNFEITSKQQTYLNHTVTVSKTPITVQFSPLIVSSLFSNDLLNRVTSRDIMFFFKLSSIIIINIST